MFVATACESLRQPCKKARREAFPKAAPKARQGESRFARAIPERLRWSNSPRLRPQRTPRQFPCRVRGRWANAALQKAPAIKVFREVCGSPSREAAHAVASLRRPPLPNTNQGCPRLPRARRERNPALISEKSDRECRGNAPAHLLQMSESANFQTVRVKEIVAAQMTDEWSATIRAG